ncbi:MAG: hypothetical protein LBG11_02245 [Bifidobacteriaceae bacterium]|nr:hypothetical protein [Bifidobacteriaceae bacterium]
MRARAMMGGLLAAGIAFALLGCSDKEEDVASLSEPSVATETASANTEDIEDTDLAKLVSDQAASAAALRDCLAQTGVTIELTEMGVGGYDEVSFQAVWPVFEVKDYVFSIPGAAGGAGEDAPENTFDLLEDDQPHLYYDGIDHSGDLVACIESSGYFMPKPRYDPREEETEKQRIAAASNEWAACARDNGLPGVKDAEVVIDDFDTVPEAMVPGSVTVDELRAVLVKCPPVDPERDLAEPNFHDENDNGEWTTWVDPMIGFDLPADDPKREELDAAVLDFVTALREEALGSAEG